MFHRLTQNQICTIQTFLEDNAHDCGIPFSKCWHVQCPDCTKCSADCFDGDVFKFQAGTPCPLCGKTLNTDRLGEFIKCTDPGCVIVRNYYGLNPFFTNNIWTGIQNSNKSIHKKRRNDVIKYFKTENNKNFRNLPFSTLEYGMLLGEVQETSRCIRLLKKTIKDKK
jgi:hypothetical protein